MDNDNKTTLEILDEKMRNSKTGEEAKEFAEAYKARTEAENYRSIERERIKMENRKSRRSAGSAIGAAALGALLTGGIKVVGDLIFQGRCQRYEDQGAYCNYTKHKRR